GFTYSEIDKCSEVICDDKTVDDLRTKNKSVILDKMMRNDDFISKGINLITQTESLERIGDYIVSMSQDIAYILSGKDTRYSVD
nr:PhoU domain-containing protein [Spirochaetota bacterium]